MLICHPEPCGLIIFYKIINHGKRCVNRLIYLGLLNALKVLCELTLRITFVSRSSYTYDLLSLFTHSIHTGGFVYNNGKSFLCCSTTWRKYGFGFSWVVVIALKNWTRVSPRSAGPFTTFTLGTSQWPQM